MRAPRRHPSRRNATRPPPTSNTHRQDATTQPSTVAVLPRRSLRLAAARPRPRATRQSPTVAVIPRRSPRLAAPTPRPLPYLPEELVDNIFVRIRPDDPAGLAKACLSSKFWCRHICNEEFLRRNRTLHPKPASIGFLGVTGELIKSTRFVPTSTFHLEPSSIPCRYKVLHERHGRVLFHAVSKDGTSSLIVWDPITKEEHVGSMPMDEPVVEHWNAALLCGADGCNELTCHDHDSTVVFVGTNQEMKLTFAGRYSREFEIWDEDQDEDEDEDEDMAEDKSTEIVHPDAIVGTGPSVVVGDKVYFPCTQSKRIIEYDNGADKIDVVDAPIRKGTTMLMTARHGALGFACVAGTKLTLWSREATGPGGAWAWERYRVLDLDLDTVPGIPRLLGSADGLILAKTGSGVFTINLKSDGEVTKVSKNTKIVKAIPYKAFLTPSCRNITLP